MTLQRDDQGRLVELGESLCTFFLSHTVFSHSALLRQLVQSGNFHSSLSKWSSLTRRCSSPIVLDLRQSGIIFGEKCGLDFDFESLRMGIDWMKYNHIIFRGLPFSTYADFSAFLTPPPPLSAKSRNLAYWALVLRPHLGLHPPSPSARTYLMEAP